MQIVKPYALGLGTRCIEYRKRFGLCVSAYIYFPFAKMGESPTLWTEMGMWQFVAKEMPTPVIDVGIVKTTPEYLVHGRVHPPGGQAEACAVRARLGNRDKTLLAFGDRYWVDEQISRTRPFESLPLDWKLAYGGPDFPQNPDGIGRQDEEISGHKVRRLPNFEYPNQRVTRRDQVVMPAGFGMLDGMWPQRAQYQGTYDDAWMKEHSPAFAPDLSWKHFNTAPQDQWFDQALRGDEDFEFEHLHPGKPLVQGQLPGFRARAFAKLRDGAEGQLAEVPLGLTTVWFFPHAERGVLIFQGMLQVGEEDGADVLSLMGAVERLGEPKDDTHYTTVYAQRNDPHKGALYALREKDLLPEGITGSDPEFDAVQEDYQVKGLMVEARIRNAEVQVAITREQVKRKGLDPDALGIRMPPREPVPKLEELPEYLGKKITAIVSEQNKAIIAAAKDIERVKAMGIDIAAQQHRGPPKYDAASELRQLMAKVPPGTVGKDGKLLVDYQKIGPQLAKAESASRYGYLISAHMQPPAPPMPPEQALSLRAEVMSAYAQGKHFRGMDLTGADLSGLDLRGADFTAAQMESVNLSGANVTRAKFSHAVLAHADLTGLMAARAQFNGANLGKAKIADAVFDRTDLCHAVFGGTDFSQSSFRSAGLRSANFLDAKFGPSDWTGANATGANFIKVALTGMVFAGAYLNEVNFIECDVTGVDFQQASLQAANFLTCKGQGAMFGGAQLGNAIFAMGCDFAEADFSGAQLKSCNLRGAILTHARFRSAELDQADLSEADLEGADLSGASVRGALFIKTRLRGAVAKGVNAMNALIQRADLRSIDLRDSNFYGADLSRIRFDELTRFGVSNFTRARTYPRRAREPLDTSPGGDAA